MDGVPPLMVAWRVDLLVCHGSLVPADVASRPGREQQRTCRTLGSGMRGLSQCYTRSISVARSQIACWCIKGTPLRGAPHP